MVLKRIIQAIVVITLSICLFFAFGFKNEVEYETTFEEGQEVSVLDEIVGQLENIVAMLTDFKILLENELSELGPLSEYVPAFENAIAICSSLIGTIEQKNEDLKGGLFVANEEIEEEIGVEWEKDGVGYEAEVEFEYKVETEENMVEVEIEYEDKIEENDDGEDLDDHDDDDDDEDDDDDDDKDNDDDDHDDDDDDDEKDDD